MPPLNTKYTLETFNVMSLQSFYMAAIKCPALTSIQEDRKTGGMVTETLVATVRLWSKNTRWESRPKAAADSLIRWFISLVRTQSSVKMDPR